MNLTPLQIDAFTELVNIGVGNAANSLNDIVGAHITLNVPEVKIVMIKDLKNVFAEYQDNPFSAVLQGFSGDYFGTAALIFPSDSAKRLVALLTKEEITSPRMDTVHSGTIMEIGNIVINSIIGTISNQLHSHLDFSLPEYQEENFNSLIPKLSAYDDNGFVIVAYTYMIIKDISVKGFIFFVYRINDMEILIKSIDNLLSGK